VCLCVCVCVCVKVKGCPPAPHGHGAVVANEPIIKMKHLLPGEEKPRRFCGRRFFCCSLTIPTFCERLN